MGGRLQRAWGRNRSLLGVGSGRARRWVAASGCVVVLGSALAATSAYIGGGGNSAASHQSVRVSASATGHRRLAGPQAAALMPAKVPPARPVAMSRQQRAEAAALALARQRGKPVVVTAETTATSEV